MIVFYSALVTGLAVAILFHLHRSAVNGAVSQSMSAIATLDEEVTVKEIMVCEPGGFFHSLFDTSFSLGGGNNVYRVVYVDNLVIGTHSVIMKNGRVIVQNKTFLNHNPFDYLDNYLYEETMKEGAS